MNKEYISNSPSQTKKIAERLARDILISGKKQKAVILSLKGELGGGKTTFLQGFAKGLGIKEKILSPTFIIFRKLPIPNSEFKHFYHIDCYRIKEAEEIRKLGLDEMISIPENIIVIEWANLIEEIIPKESMWIDLEILNQRTRKISLSVLE